MGCFSFSGAVVDGFVSLDVATLVVIIVFVIVLLVIVVVFVVGVPLVVFNVVCFARAIVVVDVLLFHVDVGIINIFFVCHVVVG